MNMRAGDVGMIFIREPLQAREPDDPFYKIVFERENGLPLELSLRPEDVEETGPPAV